MINKAVGFKDEGDYVASNAHGFYVLRMIGSQQGEEDLSLIAKRSQFTH